MAITGFPKISLEGFPKISLEQNYVLRTTDLSKIRRFEGYI